MTKQQIIQAYAHDLAVMAKENKQLLERVRTLEIEKQELLLEIRKLNNECSQVRKEKLQLLREKVLRGDTD